MDTELVIEDLAPGGEGVGRSGPRTVFVPCTAPGDRVLADVPAGEGTAHARLIGVLAPGASRVEPPCRHFGGGALASLRSARAPPIPPLAPGQPHPAGPALAVSPRGALASLRSARAPPIPPDPARADTDCGGCEWLHVRYEAQLPAKERTVREALRRIAGLAPGTYPLRPILRSPLPLRYRSRAKLHFDRASARLVFFRRRSHEPVRIDACQLLVPGLDALRAALGPALAAARLAPREVALEWSEHEGRGSALLLLEPTGTARERAGALLAAVPALAGIVLRGEAGPSALVGEPVLRLARVPGDPAAGLQRSRPDVFQQANRGANALLVSTAVELLAGDGADVLELHCGAGNFTAALGARARSVSAVEAQGPALELAREDLRGAARVRFFAGDALRVASALGAEGRRFGAVLLDPPREGAKGIGKVLRALGIPRVVYVSCDPATLARDVGGCLAEGYRVEAVLPVDMFPQTHHVEAVVALVAA